MKRKIGISLVLLIISICCCGCLQEANYEDISYQSPSFSKDYLEPIEKDDSVRDITNQKDADDYTHTVYITPYGTRYHKPYCSHAKNVYMFLTIRQAVERGYTYCYYCCC